MNECAFDHGNSCTALDCKECFCCPFHKTVAEVREGREKAMKRVRSLPMKQLKHIMRKYYNKTYGDQE